MIKQVILIVIILLYGMIFRSNIKNDRLVYLDIGNGDATLIQFEDKTILIDGGPGNNILYKLALYDIVLQPQFDVLILTHYHDDHYAGLIELMDRYQIGALIVLDRCDHEVISQRLGLSDKVHVIKVSGGDRLTLSENMQIDFIYPQPPDDAKCVNPDKSNENENSLVLVVSIYDKKYLFTGDAEYRSESKILGCCFQQIGGSEVLQAGHHCSKTSNSLAFLEVVAPKEVVCSTSFDNPFGHPSPEVIKRIVEAGYDLHISYEQGDRVVIL